MSSIKIKSFIDHKRGVDYWDGADRSAMNLERGRFAVADGVSQSFLPNLWAEILCDSFVNSNAEAEEDWIGEYSESQLTVDCQLWRERSEETLKNANEEEAFLLQLSKDEYQFAGSTLVGIVIKDHSVFYNVLGDSCFFVYNKETKKLTSYSTINEQLGFTTSPDYLLSAGKIVGQWKHGSIPLKPGFIMLMTDALSEWFTKEYAENPTLMEQLWELDSHKAFMELVENARETDAMKDDDVALLMLQVEDGYDVLYCDTMESLVALQEHVDEEKESIASENQEDNGVSEDDEPRPKSDEEMQEREDITENDEGTGMPIGISEPLNVDEVQKSDEELEEPKPNESDKWPLAISDDNVDVSSHSQEKDAQIPCETRQLEQEQSLTDDEETSGDTNKPVIDQVNNIMDYCPKCGHRYFYDNSSFCTKCGHPREVQKTSDSDIPTDSY